MMKLFRSIYLNLALSFERWYYSERTIRPAFGFRKRFFVIRRESSNVGLFSIVITTLAHIKEAEKKGLTPVVDLQNYSNAYLDKSLLHKENAWEYYFEQIENLSLKKVYKERNVVLSSGGVPIDRPNDKINFLYNCDGSLAEWRRLYKKYIHVKPSIQKKADEEFISNVNYNDRVVGVCCRGEGYRRAHWPHHPIQPEISDLIEKVEETMSSHMCNLVYLSTEDEKIVEQFRQHFGNKLFAKKRDYIKYDEDGIQGVAKTKRENGERYLIQLLMLSKCDCLVSARCSGAVGAMLMTGGYEYTFFF